MPKSSSKSSSKVMDNAKYKLADNANEVLSAVRSLRNDMIRKAEEAERHESNLELAASASAAASAAGSDDASYNDDEDALSSAVGAAATSTVVAAASGNKKRRVAEVKSIKSVDSSEIVEVAEMSTTEVLEGIESVAVKIMHQVLAKQGFTLEIPSRAASNQIYVPELDRIVLGKKRGSRSFLNVSSLWTVLAGLSCVSLSRGQIGRRDIFIFFEKHHL